MNCDIENVNVQAFGNWFSFKPGQMKPMEDRLGNFLCLEKKYLGFVSLPEICIEDPTSEEAKAAKEEKLAEGRRNIIAHLEGLKYNLEVSLQKDYDIAGLKTTSLQVEGKGHLPVYRKLKAFKEVESSEQAAVLNEINQLKGVTDGSANSTDAPAAPNRSKNISKPA